MRGAVAFALLGELAVTGRLAAAAVTAAVVLVVLNVVALAGLLL